MRRLPGAMVTAALVAAGAAAATARPVHAAPAAEAAPATRSATATHAAPEADAAGGTRAAPATPAAPADTTTIPVRPGTTVYVRYGEPGGVHIVRGRPATPDSAAARAVVPGEPGARAAWLEQLRFLIRDEIARRTVARVSAPAWRPGSLLDEETGSGATEPPAPIVVMTPEPPATPPPPPDSVAVGDTTGAPGWVPVAGPTAETPPAPSPVTPPPARPGEPAPEPVARPEPLPIGEPRRPPPAREVIRTAFLDRGLLESNLILFETGREEILPPSQEFLRSVAAVLAEFPEARLRVEGHTDDVGRAETNLELSRRRAEAVRAFLVAAGGAAADRVEAAGNGETAPLVPNDSAANRAMNRRVVIRVLNPEALSR